MRARISTTVVAGVAASMLAAAPVVAQDRGEARDNGRSQSCDDRGRDRADQQRGSAFTVTTRPTPWTPSPATDAARMRRWAWNLHRAHGSDTKAKWVKATRWALVKDPVTGRPPNATSSTGCAVIGRSCTG